MAAQETLKQQIDEAFDKVEQLYQKKIDAAHARIEELETKLRLQTDAETDAEIRRLAAREHISVEAWLKQQIEIAVEFADAPMIRVQPVFWEHVKALAAARGVLPETLMTDTEVTRRLMSLIDNSLM